MKTLHRHHLAQLAPRLQQLKTPAGFRYRLTGSLASFQPWLDKVARLSRPRR